MVKDTRQGWAIFAVMGVLFLGGLGVTLLGGSARAMPPSPPPMSAQPTGNMEGKEVRFGIANSVSVRHRHHRCLLRRRQCHA